MVLSKDNKIKKDIESKANWKKTREMGRTKFILIYGVFFWGLILAIAFFFLNVKAYPSIPWYLLLIFSLIIFCIAGYFVGYFSWKSAEKKYTTDRKSKN